MGSCKLKRRETEAEAEREGSKGKSVGLAMDFFNGLGCNVECFGAGDLCETSPVKRKLQSTTFSGAQRERRGAEPSFVRRHQL